MKFHIVTKVKNLYLEVRIRYEIQLLDGWHIKIFKFQNLNDVNPRGKFFYIFNMDSESPSRKGWFEDDSEDEEMQV